MVSGYPLAFNLGPIGVGTDFFKLYCILNIFEKYINNWTNNLFLSHGTDFQGLGVVFDKFVKEMVPRLQPKGYLSKLGLYFSIENNLKFSFGLLRLIV